MKISMSLTDKMLKQVSASLLTLISEKDDDDEIMISIDNSTEQVFLTLWTEDGRYIRTINIDKER